ncbi:fatty acid synthase-like isoform X2 [Temnothorax nylanderi]|uniref:fatty acid synthase-like isoform X2 n=1 Tax=Temnothorax nylanderi TaxID=102681 RepID=UPI003A844659
MNRPNSYISVDAEEEIVISGIAGRFPNSDNLKEFQENLFNKVDLGSSDHGRWNNSYNMPHRIGKVNNIEKFDSEFFNIPATEAHIMDPLIRMLLEHTYEAIIDAGINPKELRGTRTSVLTAICMSETQGHFSCQSQFAGLPMTECNVSLMANKISYWLGVIGQSHNIDTACSSSNVAMVKAYELIQSGKCDAAIIASANLCLHPHIQILFYNLGVLSSDGYCKPFDEEGTGYMRSDTAAVVYLQKAKIARRIYATLVHGKINCDGFKEEGITFPSVEKQKILLNKFYEECEIMPSELSYMEAHATGTLAGDPVEVMAIDQTLCAKRNTPLLMGSVKSNIGHSEPASGLCQIAKVLLAMETGIITPTIHFKRPRKELTAIIEGRIKIVTEPTEWEGGYVAINSFGFGGANGHILLKSNTKQKINNAALNDDLPRLVAVSGRTAEAVKIILDDVRNRPIDAEFISLLHHIHNDDIEGHPYRGYMINGSKISHNTINKIEHTPYIRRPICFIFSGLGSQWFGMKSIGKLYNAGLQPQIANLYPTVEFPVSRGTPMISPLIRWDHLEDLFVMRACQKKIIDKKEIVVSISTSNEEFAYLTGHVVNEKNLFPAMGYLFYIWEMIASLKNQEYINTPVVFEDVNFIRATVLSQQNEIELTFSIQEGSNRFEITEGDNAIVTGTVRIPTNIENEKISANLAECIDDEEEMNTKDIYKELRLRGYQYAGAFRGLKSASVTGSNGHIAWTSNWVAFMDSMLQMMILGQNSRSLYVPTRIRKLTIDPKYHTQIIQDCPIEDRQFSVRRYKSLDAIISGGIEICGTVATPISRRQKVVNTVLEEYKYVAHRDLGTMSLQDAIRMSTHIALECCNIINVKIIEFIDDSDKVVPEDLNSPVISEILNDLPQIRHHTKLVKTHEKFPNISFPGNVSTTEITKLSKDENCLMVLGFDILTKNSKKLYKQLLSLLMPQGFLLTLEESGAVYDYSCLKAYELDIILEKQINNKKLLLLRKTRNIARNQRIVHVNNYEFSWVDELKSIMNVQNETGVDTEIILVSEEDFECGLLGFINCLRKEPGGEIIKSVFIQDDKAPTFSLQEPLYTKQLQLDLPINVIRSGNVWGSYRHLPLPSLESKLVQRAFVTQMVQGDMSTLCWAQSRMSRINHENLINVIYTSINFRDIMVATGRLNAETIAPFERGNDCFIGLEFVGFNTHKQRIMGLCSHGGMTNILVADKYLSWIIPDKWTMEDAATIPCVYSTCYYALYIKGKMKKGDKILIHSGTGGIGQAAIHLALHEDCEVFTTVGTVEKRQFIRETFPSIAEDHIGNSRDTSFEQMIMQRTKGRGVDIVLNSLAEEKLQASVRCLGNGGRFLEIGKFDMVSNNSLDISIFSKDISFYGILLDKLFYSNAEQKSRLWKTITEGIKDGAIKPLCRRVFEKNEIEAAFRYMAAGKHIGKIIIRVHKEEEPLDAPLLAHPRYHCLDHKCYVILGGLGGFGLELADWLTLRGAKNLVLTSRTGIRTGYQQSRVKLWRSYGVDVQIVTVDDNLKHEDCESLLKFAEERAPVDAIFNLAVVLKDCIFQNQSPQTFEDSFKSKAWMTKKMDELSRKICPQLRHYVVFSSVSCGRGNAGQTNYGMANSVMERICEKRMKEGLHGLAIQWGAVGDVGLVADMQEENKELVIGGTLQQRISSCLETLEVFLLQDRPVVSSMVVAEKAKIGGSMNIYETVAHMMGLKNINAIPSNMPLAEMGMDSMMAVEIKQTLEREFDISLTAQDIRTLNFAKLRQMTITTEQGKIQATNEIDPSNLEGFDMLIRKVKDSDFVPDILVELVTKEVDRGNIFLLPGIEGCSSVYKSIASGIKSSTTCVQHGVLNIPDESHSVMKSAAYLLPHILKKMKDQRKFLIVGYSFGSLIAIELARLLEAKDFSGRLILIDGAPDQMKFWTNQYLGCTSPDELQNVVLLGLLEMYTIINKKKLAFELNKCDTWNEKLKIFYAYFPKDLNILTIENQKLIYFTVYNHIVAIQEYDISSLPRLKSPITLLKPTFPMTSFTEEDYGLHKVTEGKVQIHYVEGNHITMMGNDKIISAINEEWIEDKTEDNIIQ